ncbi:hypothetical protein, partial [Paenibacillus camerounensis]|uniref:ATP-binding protein n=1 Tax=Paenibacillus camerounensis TaxID=1243663 RepID=UPI0005A6A318
ALAEELERAEAEFAALDERYTEWLRQHRLPEGLSPEGLPDIFALAEQGNELLRQRGKLVQRLGELEAECRAFEDEVLSLRLQTLGTAESAPASDAAADSAGASGVSDSLNASTHPQDAAGNSLPSADTVSPADSAAVTHGGPVTLSPGYTPDGAGSYSGSAIPSIPVFSLLSWLENRKREWELLRIELLRREGLSARKAEIQEELTEQLEQLEGLQQLSTTLLSEGGAADGEDFLRRAAAVQQRSGLTRAVRQWELAMFSGWEGGRTEPLQQLLEQHDAAALAEERSAAEAAAAELEEERNTLLEQRGKLLQEQEYLKERCMEDNVSQQLEEQRSSLRNLAGQYAVNVIAAELIGRTRRIYEQEKQPQVLQLASVYFAKLSGGEYRRIVMTLGHKELKAEHASLGLLDSSLLSRGTQEQLYLAIRLALAETMSGKSALPLMLDDLFVNFDEHRLHAALSLAGELSLTRQIVMMTCHRHVAEAAARIIPAAAVIPV